VALAVAGAVGAESLEGPRQPVDLGGRDHRPAVGHRQLGAAGGVGAALVLGAVAGLYPAIRAAAWPPPTPCAPA
jgi:hypothetical protein